MKRLSPNRIEWTTITLVNASLQQSLVEAFPSARFPIHLRGYRGDAVPYSPFLISIHASAIHLRGDPLCCFKRVFRNCPSLCRLHFDACQRTGCLNWRYGPPPFLCPSKAEHSELTPLAYASPIKDPNLVELSLGWFTFLDDIHFILRLNWVNLDTLINDHCSNTTALLA